MKFLIRRTLGIVLLSVLFTTSIFSQELKFLGPIDIAVQKRKSEILKLPLEQQTVHLKALITAAKQASTDYSEKLDEINDNLSSIHQTLIGLNSFGRDAPGDKINELGEILNEYWNDVLNNVELSDDEIIDQTIEKFKEIASIYQEISEMRFGFQEYIDRFVSQSSILVRDAEEVEQELISEIEDIKERIDEIDTIDESELSATEKIDLENEKAILENQIVIYEEIESLLGEYIPKVEQYVSLLDELAIGIYSTFSKMGVLSSSITVFVELIEVKQSLAEFDSLLQQLVSDVTGVQNTNSEFNTYLDDLKEVFDSLSSLIS